MKLILIAGSIVLVFILTIVFSCVKIASDCDKEQEQKERNNELSHM